MEESQKIFRYEIRFFGQVQGVGFRYTAYHAASREGATGWVHNEWDGSVVMEIQGKEESIDQVMLAIERGTYVRIENLDAKTICTVPDERGFRTR